MLPRSIDEISHDLLVKHLTKITEKYRKDKDYYEIRSKFIAISMALNEKGLIAPAFRKNQPRIPFLKTARGEAHKQLLVDQIVIDCHWLHCRKEYVKPNWETLIDLFNPESEFNAEMISICLGARIWKRDFRANEILLLSDFQQNQLLMLCNEAIRENRQAIFDGLPPKDGKDRAPATHPPIQRSIRAWAERVHQIRGQQDMYEALWAARELHVEKVTQAQLAKLAGYIIGLPPLDRTTISSKYKSLDGMLDSLATS